MNLFYQRVVSPYTKPDIDSSTVIPELLNNMSMSHKAEVGNKFLYYIEHGHCSSFWSYMHCPAVINIQQSKKSVLTHVGQ